MITAAKAGFAQGYTYGTYTISTTAGGAFAQGQAYGGNITAAGGAFAQGNASGGVITANTGGFAQGSAPTGSITAYIGGFAQGEAYSYNIDAGGSGSFAHGFANSAAIVASTTNSAQFGPGTNAEADSLQVGSGIRIKGTTGVPASALHDGDIWVASNYVYIRSNGTSVKVVACP